MLGASGYTGEEVSIVLCALSVESVELSSIHKRRIKAVSGTSKRGELNRVLHVCVQR